MDGGREAAQADAQRAEDGPGERHGPTVVPEKQKMFLKSSLKFS